MTSPTFGMTITVLDDQPRPAITADMSIAGLVGLAPNADPSVFPLNTPVLVYSDDTVALAALGTGGTLYDAISGINQQLTDFESSALVVVVRVSAGADTFHTIGNLVGDPNARTGMFALRNSAALTGATPRLVAVPGYTSQAISQVDPVNSTFTAGSGYTSVPTVTFSGGGSDPNKRLPAATVTVANGAITGIVWSDLGASLSGTVTAALSGGSGTGGAITVVLDTYSNAVIAGLPSLLDALLAHSFVDGPGTNDAAATNWRTSISSKRIIPIDVPVMIQDADGTVRSVPAAPIVIGAQIATDFENRSRPFSVAANRAINGIVGVGRTVDFSILDGATEGQVLLSHQIGIIVKGNYADGSIADSGYIVIVAQNCSPDPLWTFYNQTRGRDFIHLMFIKTLRSRLGKNITRQSIQVILNTMTIALRDLQADGDILGFKVGFDRGSNSSSDLRSGKFTVSFAAEEPAPLMNLGIQSARYLPALDTLLSDLLAQLDPSA
jgi:phage tail sheath protein FI